MSHAPMFRNTRCDMLCRMLRRFALRSIIVIVTSTLGHNVALAIDPSLEDINSATTSSELSSTYSHLLLDTSYERQQELKTHASTGIAIQSAWQQLVATVPDSSANVSPAVRQTGRSKISHVALAGFLGFVEGRLQVTPPLWWREMLYRAKLQRDFSTELMVLTARPERQERYYEVYADERGSIFASGHVTSASRDANEVALTHEAGTIDIPCVTLSDAYVEVVPVGTQRYIVAIHGELPTSRLLCIDRSSKNILWDSSVWCDNAPYVRSGGGFFHWSQVKMNNDLAIVFGMCNDVVYIEAFDINNGNPISRFSSSYVWKHSD